MVKINHIRKESASILKNKYGEAFFVSSACFVIFVLFKLFETLISALFLHEENVSPWQLFYSDNYLWLTFTIAYKLFFFSALIPVLTGAVWWFSQAASKNNERSDSVIKLYTSLKINLRSALVFFILYLLHTLILLLSCISFYSAYSIGISYGKSSLMAFIAIQLAILGAALLSLYAYTLLATSAAPFIFVKYPMGNPFKIIALSFRLMKGKKLFLIKIFLSYSYLLILIPFVITVPFITPFIAMPVAVFMQNIIPDEQLSYLKLKRRKPVIGKTDIPSGI